MTKEINTKINSLLKSKPLQKTVSFYNDLLAIDLELAFMELQKKIQISRKLEKIIPKILDFLIEELNSYNREKIISLLSNLQIEYYSDELIHRIITVLIEVINWDNEIRIRTKATNVIYNFISINLKDVKKKQQISIVSIFDNHQKLIEIYYKSKEPAIKSKISTILSKLAINLFSEIFSKLNIKERMEIYHAIIDVLIDSFKLAILDLPRRITIDSFEPIIYSLLENLKPDPVRYDLIRLTISKILDFYEFLPIVYHEIILTNLFNLVINLGETLTEEIIIRMIILLESTSNETLQSFISENLTKIAQKYQYIFANKLISQYGLLVERYKQSKTRLEKNQLLTSLAKKCFWCNYPIDLNAKKCLNCGIEILRCSVCKLPIDLEDEIGFCSICETKGHLIHLQEWVNINGKCPSCLQDLPLEGVIQLIKEND